jgi:hypothetical protein
VGRWLEGVARKNTLPASDKQLQSVGPSHTHDHTRNKHHADTDTPTRVPGARVASMAGPHSCASSFNPSRATSSASQSPTACTLASRAVSSAVATYLMMYAPF